MEIMVEGGGLVKVCLSRRMESKIIEGVLVFNYVWFGSSWKVIFKVGLGTWVKFLYDV